MLFTRGIKQLQIEILETVATFLTEAVASDIVSNVEIAYHHKRNVHVLQKIETLHREQLVL
jgi:hypothetical protein